MTLDQKQKQFWNRHAKRNKNPRDPNVPVLLGAFVSRSTDPASACPGMVGGIRTLGVRNKRTIEKWCPDYRETAGKTMHCNASSHLVAAREQKNKIQK